MTINIVTLEIISLRDIPLIQKKRALFLFSI